MKRILTALTFALLLLTLVACGGSIQPPDVPDEPTVPEEPQGPARKYIQWQSSTWIGERRDLATDEVYEVRLKVKPNYGDCAVFSSDLNFYNKSATSFSDAYIQEFCDKFFDVQGISNEGDYNNSENGIRSALVTVQYYDTDREYDVENDEWVEHDYYIEFEFVVDYLNAFYNDEADSSVYNRFTYAIKQPNPNDIPDYINWSFDLVPVKHSDEEYFTDEKVVDLLNTWYEGIFKSTWANPEVGTAMVELVDGTPTIPDRIRFTIDPTVPDMTEEGGLEHQHPTALLGLGTFRRTRV